ncbi:MAG: type II toxin-antitoxin system prevent-host-death family antitoxin [Kineosporiaceae bacterium]|nr:type II toxin-antitoxin system prevent-host-death family antitoxin [Kineosporiaceae bacterium]
METVGAYEAKTHLARLLQRVEAGESVAITRHGREIARLVPVQHRADAATAVAELRIARTGIRRGEASIRELINEGRR